MTRGRHRASFDQVSEFDRGRIVTYKNCGLSFREINQVMDETKQLRCVSIIARCRRKRRTDRANRTHLVAPLSVMISGL
ncbi:hypothetical protein TNCV_714331 [Trichonephila clavipes]|nr:hypothetical protein TNCV_714331 [Trichonephila clavipes]